jgi:hypothetical protein
VLVDKNKQEASEIIILLLLVLNMNVIYRSEDLAALLTAVSEGQHAARSIIFSGRQKKFGLNCHLLLATTSRILEAISLLFHNEIRRQQEECELSSMAEEPFFVNLLNSSI